MQIGPPLSKTESAHPHYRFNPPLLPVRILKRYKRFLADIEGPPFEEILTVHCANPGGMHGLIEPQGEAWISDSQNPKRKLRYSLELVRLKSGAWVCVNTNLANKIVHKALEQGEIRPFIHHICETESTWISKNGEKSRFDFKLTHPQGHITYLEVKSVTYLLNEGHAAFPDAQTKRGQKHMQALMDVIEQGHQACLLFLITRSQINRLSPAWEIDPLYAQLLVQAQQKGVLILAYTTEISPQGISLSSPCPIDLSQPRFTELTPDPRPKS